MIYSKCLNYKLNLKSPIKVTLNKSDFTEYTYKCFKKSENKAKTSNENSGNWRNFDNYSCIKQRENNITLFSIKRDKDYYGQGIGIEKSSEENFISRNLLLSVPCQHSFHRMAKKMVRQQQ